MTWITVITLFVLGIINPGLSSWAPWSAYGPCMKTCGQGISFKRRMCQSSKQADCPGEHTKYRICNDQECPGGESDVRKSLCRRYNHVPYEGKYLSWTSQVEKNNFCTLICKANSGGHVVKLQSVDLDGIECGNGSYCLGGKCSSVGCDKVFGSNTAVDICGVCGGVNATCDLKSGTKAGKYYWKTTWAPCSVTCGTGYQEADLQCASIRSGRPVEQSHCVQTQGWIITRKQCNMPSCEATWRIGKFGPCSAECGGGMQSRRVECVQGNQEISRVVDSKLCPLPQPFSEQTCNNHKCGSLWSVGLWSACSTTCGPGHMRRSVVCTTKMTDGRHLPIKEHMCRSNKPETSKPCYTKACKIDAQYIPLIRSENLTFIQLKQVPSINVRVGSNAVIIPNTRVTIRCPVKNFPPHIVNWKKNNHILPLYGRVRKSMKGALKIRHAIAEKDAGTYTCFAGSLQANSSIKFQSLQNAEQLASSFNSVDDDLQNNVNKDYKVSPGIIADASGSRRKKVQFLTKQWSPCTVSCGFGTQTREVNCAIKTDSYLKLYPDTACLRSGLQKPETIQKCVEMQECPTWKVGQWSNCTTQHCIRDGFAMITRQIDCLFSNGTITKANACHGEMVPEHRRICSNSRCVSLWRTSKWTGCRPYCGPTRYKYRILSCIWKHTKKSAGVNCKRKQRPHARVACDSSSCINVCRDKSRYCSLVTYMKMCRYPQFRTECCRSCSNHISHVYRRHR
ncbi:protein madd-4-like isoform X2 [Argonauta hians]